MSSFQPVNAVLCGITALAIATSASAQTSKHTFTSPTGLKAYAWFTTSGAQSKSTTAGGSLIPSASVSARSGSGSGSVSASYATGKNGSVTTTLNQTGVGRYLSSRYRAYGSTGSQDTLLTLKPGKAMTGTLTVTWTITARDNAYSSILLDIGNDKKYEWSASRSNASKSFRISVPVTGLAILTRSNGSASSSSTRKYPYYSSRFSMRWEPDLAPCRFTPYGKTCGPLLIGSSTPTGALNFYLGSAAPKNPILLLLGTKSVQLQIPGTTCYLATMPILTVTSMADASGLGLFSFRRPEGKITGMMTQGVSLDFKTLKILFSNGIRIDCP